MAKLTPLDLDEARAIGRHYGLEVARARGMLEGSVNSNFELETAAGQRFFLRVYEEQRASTAAREAALLTALALGGVPTPRPLCRADDPRSFLSEHAGKPVAVFPWVDGSMSCQSAVTAPRLVALGSALAEVHAAGPVDLTEPSARFGPAALVERLALARKHPEVTPEVLAVIDRLGELLGREIERARPGGGDEDASDVVVHGDLFRDNVLWRSRDSAEVAALLDFESASRGAALFDLAVTLLAWCYASELDAGLARALVSGYAARRALDPRRDGARLFEEARFAALRFATTRITDFELRPRGSGVHKDFRRFVARLDAVLAVGEAGFARLL